MSPALRQASNAAEPSLRRGRDPLAGTTVFLGLELFLSVLAYLRAKRLDEASVMADLEQHRVARDATVDQALRQAWSEPIARTKPLSER
jgi:hypothetical protein